MIFCKHPRYKKKVLYLTLEEDEYNSQIMKRPLLYLAIFIGTIITMQSQDISFGIKGGINQNSIGDFYSFGGSLGAGVPDESFPAESVMGFQYGAYLKLNINYFFIRPELNFVSLENTYSFPTKPAQWTSTQIDFPILFGYNIYGPASIYGGPVFSTITEMTMEGWEDTGFGQTGPFTYMNSSVAISAGIMFDFGRFGLDLRYQYGLTTVPEQHLDMVKTYNGYGVNVGKLVEYNPSQILLNLQVGLFNFGGGKKRNRSKSDWRNHRNLR